MPWIKKLYLYVVSLVSLVILIVAAIMLINMGIKSVLKVNDYVYYPSIAACDKSVPPAPNSATPAVATCDEAAQQRDLENQKKQQSDQHKRDIAQALAMIIVAAPVFWYHWRLARLEA